MKVDQYIAQFGVLGSDEYINCDKISQMLYEAYLNKFQITYTSAEYELFNIYQHRIFDIVENMRELNEESIKIIFNYLNKHDIYVVDNIIMSWCLPRANAYYSKISYRNKYAENISKYIHKLINLIHHNLIKDFCCTVCTKSNSVPVHCIDLLWYYMDNMQYEFAFVNYECGDYITFTVSEKNDIEFKLNMHYILDMGLGNVLYIGDKKPTFKTLLQPLIEDSNVINHLKKTETGDNYISQVIGIRANSKKYYDVELPPIDI